MDLAKLTAISTDTLSLLLQRQRQQSLPSARPSNASNGSTLVPQIKRNLETLRTGIVALEEKTTNSALQESLTLLRGQHERMRDMLGSDAEDVMSMKSEGNSSNNASGSSSPAPGLFNKSKSSSTEALYTPYKDDPEAGTPFSDEDDQDPHALLQTQRHLMDEQDTHLENLSHSINRQRDLSLQINDELSVHHGLLEDLDGDLDITGNRLSGARRRLDRVAAGAKKNYSTVAIGTLIFLLLVLIIIFKT
ncbi:syntaxin-like protein [Flagelloscypha sp. PMI_526]|nr:syntaxin-like protein [Flagelloscypha sp. PMI_526]